MTKAPYELISTPDGVVARINARGSAVLSSPTINRGTAFTLEEREALGLTGLLPTGVSTLEGQLRRVYAQYLEQANDLRKWVYLANLRDRNEVLFYRLLTEHISEMLPVVYTPTVGLAIERFSQEFRRTRGIYLSRRPPGGRRNRLPEHRSRAGRRRPAGRHRLRGHPRHRRPGRRRHRDLHRQTRRLHRRRRHPPPPGAAGGAGHGHQQPQTAQRRHVSGCPARQGPRPAVRRPDRRLRHRGQQAVPERDAALGGLRLHQRPPHPEQIRRPGLHLQRRHAGHRSNSDGRGVLRGARRRHPDPGPDGSSSTAPAPPAWASPT